MTGPRVYVEAAERFARDAGCASRIHRVTPCMDVIFLIIAKHASAPALVIPVTAGTISLTDALRILQHATTV